MAEQLPRENMSYRIRRDASGVWGWFRDNWRTSKWLRRAGYLAAALLVLYAVVWFTVTPFFL